MGRINSAATRTERAFNIAGVIPLVAISSGMIRMYLGTAQAVAGVSVSILGSATWVLTLSRKGSRAAGAGAEHLKHGVLNVVRGAVEMAAGETTIGSILLMIAELSSKHPFDPIYPYEADREPKPVVVRVLPRKVKQPEARVTIEALRAALA